MRVEREIEVGGRKVVVRELTVGEVRRWLKELADRAEAGREDGDGLDVVTEALFEDVSLDDVRRMTDLSRKDLDALTPSQIREIVRVCEEVNRHFFDLRARLMALGRGLGPSSSS